MKRDMDLIGKMLLFIEDQPSGSAPDELRFEVYTENRWPFRFTGTDLVLL
jgi:hypothetical protein